jgi:hypothetical protein
MTALSLVLCSRNDAFQGDSRWRLEMSVNAVVAHAAALGRLDDLEVVVSDWGSEEPLRDVVRLSDDARRVVRFLTVPVDLAREQQRDSRFAEVIAINAAARRAHGEYIGRIDQDTLVGRHFLEWFFAALERGDTGTGFPLDSSVMIANRRRVPYELAVRTPPAAVLRRYLAWGDRRLPQMRGNGEHYWECYVGMLLLHRRLWAQCGGYDESFIHYSYMEFDLFLRLASRYAGVDLGRIVDTDFYHLDHLPAWRSWRVQSRTNNTVIRTLEAPPPEFCPTGPDWGLVRSGLELEPAPVDGPRLAAEELAWRAGLWPAFLRDVAVSSAITAGRIVRDQAACCVAPVVRRRWRSTATS